MPCEQAGNADSEWPDSVNLKLAETTDRSAPVTSVSLNQYPSAERKELVPPLLGANVRSGKIGLIQIQRLEIAADSVEAHAQLYPYLYALILYQCRG